MCDTLGIYQNGQNLIGKNSDRPVGEAQPLVFVPGAAYECGATVRCTHLTLPQAEKTYAVIGSQPYWIWGFEMGVNEHGLFIGNEAEYSRNAESGIEGLLGMDMLRLALERSRNCREAINVLTALLEEYGQNANASMLFDRRYENSFMLADPQEMWVMETAGREWVTRRITDYGAISNCYSIQTEFDASSKTLIQTAVENEWQNPGEPFNFAKAYTLPALRQSRAAARFRRMNDLLLSRATHNFDSIKGIFRDHMEGTVEESRFGAEAGHFYTLCMHPMTWEDSKTAASLLVSYDDVLGLVMRHAFSVPCTSIYMPIYFTGYLPSCMQRGGKYFDEHSLWWCVERLTVAVSADSAAYKEKTVSRLRVVETLIESRRAANEQQAKTCISSGQRERGYEILNKYMDESADLIQQTVNDIYSEVAVALQQAGGLYGTCRELILWYKEHCGLCL